MSGPGDRQWVEDAIRELSALAPATHIRVSDDLGCVSAHAPSGDGASGPLGHLGTCLGFKSRKGGRR